MSVSKISEQKDRPDLKNVLIDLLESIALEEMAISHLLNAESEKIKAFVGNNLDFPFCKNVSKIIEFCRTTNEFIDKLVMKQWLLQNKLNKVQELNYSCLAGNTEKTLDTNNDDCTRPLGKFFKSDK